MKGRPCVTVPHLFLARQNTQHNISERMILLEPQMTGSPSRNSHRIKIGMLVNHVGGHNNFIAQSRGQSLLIFSKPIHILNSLEQSKVLKSADAMSLLINAVDIKYWLYMHFTECIH